MSHTRVKTTYSVMGAYGSTDIQELYCHHNHTCDIVSFHHSDGSIVGMIFEEWVDGDDLYDAMERLMYPFKDTWHGVLKDKVEYSHGFPWEEKNNKKQVIPIGTKIRSKYKPRVIKEGYVQEHIDDFECVLDNGKTCYYRDIEPIPQQ